MMSRPWGSVAACLVVGLVLAGTSSAAGEEAAGTGTRAGGVQDMVLTILDAGTQRPIPGAVVTLHAYDADKPIPKPPPNTCAIIPKHSFSADDQGRLSIPLSKYRLGYVRVTVAHPGHAGRELLWSGGDGDPRLLPAAYTVKLDAGRTIGGVVRDEAGRPVPGAAVSVEQYMTYEDQLPVREGNLARGSATTDAEGKWAVEDMPPTLRNVMVEVSHPDFLKGRMAEADLDKLPARSASVTLRAGVAVTGTVVDKENHPVAGASVCYDIHTSQVPSVTTDAQGRFRVDRLPAKEVTLVAQAKGYAPTALDFDPAKGEDARLVLGDAHVFQGRVVDAAGNPIQNVSIDVRRWGKREAMRLIRASTDASGRFSFDGPEEAVAIEAYHRDYMSLWMRVLDLSTPEHRLVMLSPLKVVGTATDADTGQPLEKFRVVSGYGDGGLGGWDTHNVKSAYDGRYEFTLSSPREIYKVRIEADGYLPATSPDIRYGPADDGKPVTFDARLRKGAGPAGTVVTADRRPLAGAEVVLTTPDTHTMLSNMRVSRIQNYSKVAKTDPEGRFSFPPTDQNFTLLVLHDAGYAEVPKDELAKSSTITLQPWGRIEGQILIGRQPAARQTAMIMSTVSERSPGKPNVWKDWKVEADDAGRFSFDRMPAGEYRVGRMLALSRGRMTSYTVTHACAATVTAGKTATVTIGGTGRAIVGKLRLPTDLPEKYQFDFMNLAEPRPKFPNPQPANWDSMTQDQKKQWVVDWNNSDEVKARNAKLERAYRTRRYYPFAVDAREFTFRIEDVEPGQYEFSGRVNPVAEPGFPNSGKTLAELSVPVTVPEGADAWDVGTLELKRREPATRPAGK